MRAGFFVALGRLIGCLLFLAAMPVAFAEEMFEQPMACSDSSREQARSLAEGFSQLGEYEHAGECYEVAGEYELANRSFLRALGPSGKATAADLFEQRQQAKILLERIERAFHEKH